MHADVSGESVPKKWRVLIFAGPRLFADTTARALSLAGWPVEGVCCDPSEVATCAHTLGDRHVAIVVDGALPSADVVALLRLQRPGLPVVVVSDNALAPDPETAQVSVDVSLVDLVRALERLTGTVTLGRPLTSRHLEILQLVANGYTTDEVGVRLGIASKTVNNHLSAVYRRLHTRNLTQAVLRAARAGLIDVSAA